MHAIKIMQIFNPSENYWNQAWIKITKWPKDSLLVGKYEYFFVAFQQMCFMDNSIHCGRRLHTVGHIYQ